MKTVPRRPRTIQERRDIARDRYHLAYERFRRDIDIAHRNHHVGHYR